MAVPLLLLAVALTSACGAAGKGDWYYHWSCNGDPECLSLNPTGAASGTTNEGPEQVNCTQLMEFASRFWNIPPATNSCDRSPTAPPARLTSITISPANPQVPLGLTRQMTATGHYADGTDQDLTSQVSWDASRDNQIGFPHVAEISTGGLLTANALGSTTVTATITTTDGYFWAQTIAYVGAASIQSIDVAPSNPSIARGTTQQFTATGHYSDGSSLDVTAQAAWASGATSVATVNGPGLATGVSMGTASISATRGGMTGNATLTVGPPQLLSLSVYPASRTVAQSHTGQFRAIGTYSDGTLQDITGLAVWSSGTPSVASISVGLASGIAAGVSTLDASVGPVSGSATLTVSAAALSSISVAPATPSIAPGATVAFTAVGNFSDGTSQALLTGVSWGSGTVSAATIDSTGHASGVAVGSSAISATAGMVSGTTLLTVTLTPPGVNWAYLPASPPHASFNTETSLSSIVWSGTQFVAVALDAAIFSSPDGITWTTRDVGMIYGSPWNGPLLSVAWSPAQMRFVVVGGNSILTSSDGITWTKNTSGVNAGTGLRNVIWSGTQFVAVGNQWAAPGTAVILTSPDGLTWTSQTSGTNSALRSVAWSGTQYVAVGDATLISPDGSGWTRVMDGTYGWNSVAWSGAQFVAVGDSGQVRTSADGIAWTARTVAPPEKLNDVIWTGTQFVAVGGSPYNYPAHVFTSPDAMTWTSPAVGAVGTEYGYTMTMNAVAWSGTRLVAVGDQFYIYTSP